MEEKLTRLFDLQLFSGHDRLNDIIAGVEARYDGALADDDLELVSAAGEALVPTMHPDMLLAQHDLAGREETP